MQTYFIEHVLGKLPDGASDDSNHQRLLEVCDCASCGGQIAEWIVLAGEPRCEDCFNQKGESI
jgi:hypothetical protein